MPIDLFPQLAKYSEVIVGKHLGDFVDEVSNLLGIEDKLFEEYDERAKWTRGLLKHYEKIRTDEASHQGFMTYFASHLYRKYKLGENIDNNDRSQYYDSYRYEKTLGNALFPLSKKQLEEFMKLEEYMFNFINETLGYTKEGRIDQDAFMSRWAGLGNTSSRSVLEDIIYTCLEEEYDILDDLEKQIFNKTVQVSVATFANDIVNEMYKERRRAYKFYEIDEFVSMLTINANVTARKINKRFMQLRHSPFRFRFRELVKSGISERKLKKLAERLGKNIMPYVFKVNFKRDPTFEEKELIFGHLEK